MKNTITFFCFLLLFSNFSLSYDTSAPESSRIFETLEKKFHAKIGICAIDTNSNQVLSYRAESLFPFQSTFKFMAVSALLSEHKTKDLLNKTAVLNPKEIIFWHPISGQYISKPVALKTLAAGAISYSDNTAVNAIVRELGGPEKINQFARRIGNKSFQLENYEMNLNSNPNKTIDTVTPKDMAYSIKKILLSDEILKPVNKTLLLSWMRNNTTGYKRIRSGVPLGWSVADKTGSGSYGVANDIGIAWSPACKPVVLSIYTTKEKVNEKWDSELIQSITEATFAHFSKHAACFRETDLNQKDLTS